jgi:peroxiredoxin
MVEEGAAAPDFELTSDSGERVKLSDFRGKPVVLYFYPLTTLRAAPLRPASCGTTTRSSGNAVRSSSA